MKLTQILFLIFIILPINVVCEFIIGPEWIYFDLFIILVIFFSNKIEQIPLIYISFSIGLIKDLLSGPFVGLNGFSFPLIALCAQFIFSKLHLKKVYFNFLMVFALVLLNTIIVNLLIFVLGIEAISQSFMEYLYISLANGILGVLVFNFRTIIPRRKNIQEINLAD